MPVTDALSVISYFCEGFNVGPRYAHRELNEWINFVYKLHVTRISHGIDIILFFFFWRKKGTKTSG